MADPTTAPRRSDALEAHLADHPFLPGAESWPQTPPREHAPGRLQIGPPVAVVDIGSNSVRLVVYEGMTRSPTPLFNEKALCGLGREVRSTGRLPDEAVAKALAALRRFRALCDTIGVGRIHVLATAAVREAENGAAFVAEAERLCGTTVEVLTGAREARLAALGVVSGIWRPDGVVGDLGGGSLELVDVSGDRVGEGTTLPLGGLALQDTASRSVRKAEKIVRDQLEGVPEVLAAAGRTFYAVGGTWRSLARLHQFQRGYPLHMMHGYTIPAREALEFARLVHRSDPDTLAKIDVVSAARRPLLGFGALVLEHVVRIGRPAQVVISALGVREGLLYELLDEEERAQDPLLSAARELGLLRSRSPRHGEELIMWTDALFAAADLDETPDERRLRHAACLLADIGWRAHPDYRGAQSLNIIANAAFVGIDHPGRAFLALTVFYRHVGLIDDAVSPRLRELVSSRLIDRARVIGAAMRVAYLVSAASPGVLPRVLPRVEDGRLILILADDLAPLGGDRVFNRLRALARLVGKEPMLVTA